MRHKAAKEQLEKNINNYDQIAESFDMTRNRDWEEFLKFLPHIEDGHRLVDLGCGNGRFHSFIREHRDVDYIGIDNSKGLLDKARKNHPKAKFLDGDLLEIPLPKEDVDVAVAIASFHHLPSVAHRHKSLQEVNRVLKKGGTFIITVWNLFQPKYRKYIRRAHSKSLFSLGKYHPRDTFIPWSNSGVDRYYYAFKIKELVQLLTENGFEVLEKAEGNNLLLICKKS